MWVADIWMAHWEAELIREASRESCRLDAYFNDWMKRVFPDRKDIRQSSRQYDVQHYYLFHGEPA